MNKKLKETKQYSIEFTEEELAEFGWDENQKIEVTENEDGSILLEPYKKIPIDLDLFSKEDLMYIITESCRLDVSTNDIIAAMILESIEGEEDNDES